METKQHSTGHADTGTKKLIARTRHDLRSPLTALKGFASIMLSRGDRLSPAQHRQFIETICQASDQVVRIVDSLDVLLKDIEGEAFVRPERSDISDLARKALRDWGDQDISREFRLKVADGLPYASCDPIKTRLVIDALIEYVIGYAQAGSPISVEVESSASKITITMGDANENEASGSDGPPSGKRGIIVDASERIAKAHGGNISEKMGTVIFELPASSS
jgi:K+-sensing histidine kinase KdpD